MHRAGGPTLVLPAGVLFQEPDLAEEDPTKKPLPAILASCLVVWVAVQENVAQLGGSLALVLIYFFGIVLF